MSNSLLHPGTPVSAPLYAMVILLPDVEEAQRVAAALDDARCAESSLAVIAVPPVRGLAFFADRGRQEKLDRWWAHAIPRHSAPVSLLRHQPGVEAWLHGLDGHFVIGAGPPDDHRYAGLDNVTVAPTERGVDVAVAAVEWFANCRVFRDDAVAKLQHRLGRTPVQTGFRRARLRPVDEQFLAGTPAAASSHPIPNVPVSLPTAPAPADVAVPPPPDDAGRDDLVRALAETLRRLQKIRSGA